MNTIIILDWDDTLFPTTEYLTVKYSINFDELDGILYNFFDIISKYGKIYIVTNAMKNWVIGLLEYMPKTKQHINRKKIVIISARDTYEYKGEMTIMEWKPDIFKTIAKYKTNVIIVGDSEYERIGIIELNKCLIQESYLKLIKFVPSPTYQIIKEQIIILGTLFRKSNLINIKRNIDYMFRIK